VENTQKIQLLHYDCVGINSWIFRWNWQMDVPRNVMNIRRNRYEQFLLYQQAKSQKELSLLYKRLHYIPIWERIVLYLLGMLKLVKLNQKLFFR